MTVLKLGMTIKNFIANLNANFTELTNKPSVNYKVLFSGSASIPSNSSGNASTITLTDDIREYDGIIIQREGCSAWESFESISIGRIFKVMSCEADFELMEGCNLYLCNAEVISATQLMLSDNVYAGVKTSAAGRYITSFDERPITKVIGVKFN